jgi:hypothetical protein
VFGPPSAADPGKSDRLMNSDDLTYFKAWFADYVAAYYTGDPVHDRTIRLKEEHTGRVCKEIVMLGQALDLVGQDMFLAETTALFHDVGRFEQYAAHGTFKDAISENHAELGLKELAKHRVLSICSDMERSLITKAIGYHNVRILPEHEDERCLFFARLLRDADKLDIWHVFIDYYEHQDEQANSTIVWDLPNNEACSPKIVKALRLKKMAETGDMATLNDFKLLQISWVFDLNFRPTFSAVRERRYVEKIADRLPQTSQIQQLVAMVQGYLEERESSSHVILTPHSIA